MTPTLRAGDVAVVWKDAYRSSSPAVGDMVVFAPSSRDLVECADIGVSELVKRVVAVPGDKISSTDTTILVNGSALHSHWKHAARLLIRIVPQTIPPDTYFVVGDNYPRSCDSRVWGPIPRSDIIGKVVRELARQTGSMDPFSVDFDPRSAKRLADGSTARQRYLDHVTTQALDVLRRDGGNTGHLAVLGQVGHRLIDELEVP